MGPLIVHQWLRSKDPLLPLIMTLRRAQGRDEGYGLYALLRERGVRPVVAHQDIGARTATPAERRYLGIRGSEPVLP